jgi:hypothetical protein
LALQKVPKASASNHSTQQQLRPVGVTQIILATAQEQQQQQRCLKMPAAAAVSGGPPSDRHFEVAAELFPDYPPGFPYENFDLSLVNPPEGEDFGVLSDDDEALAEADVEAETGFGNVIG